MNEVYIKQRGRNTEIFIDNTRIQGVRYVNYENDAECIPKVTLEFYTDKLDVYVTKEE